jgi:predicted metalloprotease with PDZ domain
MKIKRSLVLCISVLLCLSSAAMSSAVFDQEAPVVRAMTAPQRSFLGVELGEVTRDTVQRLKLREERGALIEEVTAGSSAAQAGLLTNDVIVKWDGESVESAREVSRHIRETPVGRSVRLGVMREGREVEVNVKMGERQAIMTRPRIVSTTPIARAEVRAQAMRAREEARAATARVREETRAALAQARQEARAAVRVREQVHVTGRLGVQLQSMTPQLAEYFGLSKRSGALVVFVYADSAAAKAGLKAGDVILSAGGQTVENPMDLRHALVAKQEGAVELRILRDKQEQTLTVQIEKRSGILLEDGDCIESSVRAAIESLDIEIPRIVVSPVAIQVPQIAINPMVVAAPVIKIDPIVVPKVEITPMNITVPRIRIDPVKIVVVPKRVEL